jgi:hypothetical protein
VLTPTEAATKNDLHPVDFRYKDQKLLSVSEWGTQAGTGTAAPITAADAASPSSKGDTVVTGAANSAQVPNQPAQADASPAAGASPAASCRGRSQRFGQGPPTCADSGSDGEFFLKRRKMTLEIIALAIRAGRRNRAEIFAIDSWNAAAVCSPIGD